MAETGSAGAKASGAMPSIGCTCEAAFRKSFSIRAWAESLFVARVMKIYALNYWTSAAGAALAQVRKRQSVFLRNS